MEEEALYVDGAGWPTHTHAVLVFFFFSERRACERRPLKKKKTVLHNHHAIVQPPSAHAHTRTAKVKGGNNIIQNVSSVVQS